MSIIYPYKYPKLYGELAMQGKDKKDLAQLLGITPNGLRYKQDITTTGDFTGGEMKKIATYLNKPVQELFEFKPTNPDQPTRKEA